MLGALADVMRRRPARLPELPKFPRPKVDPPDEGREADDDDAREEDVAEGTRDLGGEPLRLIAEVLDRVTKPRETRLTPQQQRCAPICWPSV